MGTIVEQIIAEHAREGFVAAGDIATVTPDVLMLNDVSGPIAFETFEQLGAARPAAPHKVVLIADHAPASDIASASAIDSLRQFARRHGLRHSTSRDAAASSTRCWTSWGWWGVATLCSAPTATPARRVFAASWRPVPRIFFRNAINLGLPVIVCPAAAQVLQAGQTARLRVATNLIEQGEAAWEPEILDGKVAASGGLRERTRDILAQMCAAKGALNG